jgi:3-oxoacyl-[acyl-carrier protein] reductase
MNETATRALVTGGSGGIGAAICRRLGLAGHFVYVHAHRGGAAAEAIAGDIVKAGGAAATVHFIDLSVNGFYNVTQPLMLPMIRTRWGRIISISSVTALAGNRGQVNYAAAKGALHAATKALSLEVASRGITVNAVAPGIIASGMGDAAFDVAAIADMVPMKRAGRAEEVADLVGFLASEQAAYITGQVISINGGMI